MKNRLLKDSFRNAFSGIFQAFKTERNIKLHCVSAILAIVFAYILKFQVIEWILIVFIITVVFVTELLNTAVEYSIDMVCGNKYNEIAKYAKDIAAGATLIAAVGAICVFLLLYLPKIIQLI
ncbi:MAG: diacylglycerol kinase [Firmicutes bacterium HGW-Firmicutes-7]|nr:MAG: diacylglycerol kinase [Firmicutes bacterium HGW-Firmicutes-7]